MKKVKVSLAAAFHCNGKPVADIPAAVMVDKLEWDDGDDAAMRKLIPPVNMSYRFRKGLVRDLNTYWRVCNEPLFLFGPTGSGKSSFIQQAYARLEVPLFRMTLSSDTELAEVFGHYVLGENGQTVFRYGPAALAAKFGFPLLLDEVGRATPETLIGMNGLFEAGSPFVIPGNGETVIPHADFRLILTDNTNLAGDESGNYLTAMVHDKSVLDRMGMSIEVGYPVDEERELLTEQLALLANDKLLTYWFSEEKMEVATPLGIRKGQDITRSDFIEGILKVRDMIRQQSRDCGNHSASALERTMSVRTLQRWLQFCIAFVGAPKQGYSALHYAMERSLTNTCTPSTKIAIHAMVKSVFGVSEKLN